MGAANRMLIEVEKGRDRKYVHRRLRHLGVLSKNRFSLLFFFFCFFFYVTALTEKSLHKKKKEEEGAKGKVLLYVKE